MSETPIYEATRDELGDPVPLLAELTAATAAECPPITEASPP